MHKLAGEQERIRKELAERASITELLDTKSKIYTVLEEKPTLKEV